MNQQSSDIDPAIQRLLARIADYERRASSLKNAINVLCEEAGLPLMFPEGSNNQPTSSPSIISKIKDDTFYGKKQHTAIREYLEMRKTQGLGPAKPREIFDALKAGGYQFEAKDDFVALVSLRALLRKRSHVFHKLPNGSYGMATWYPDARSTKGGDKEDARGGEKKRPTDLTIDEINEALGIKPTFAKKAPAA